MGNTDSIPVVSQLKSGVQLICRDTEGAGRTQEHFFHECPVFSQATSLGYLIVGDPDAALETQKRCGKGLLNAADGIPVLGHAKGVVHYICGDKEGGHRAMKSATRTTGVLAGGAAGFLLGGPVGAIAGGMSGGALTDVSTSVVTGTPSGYIAAIHNAATNPNPGDIFDLCLMPVADGVAGYSAGTVVRRLTTPSQATVSGGSSAGTSKMMQSQADLVKAGELRAQAAAIYEAAEAQSGIVPEIQTLTEMRQVSKLWQAADALEGNVKTSLKPQPVRSNVTIAPTQVDANETESQQQKQRQKQRQQERQRQKQRLRQRQAQRQRSSEESSDEECSCDSIEIPVVYANMRSINPKNLTLSMETKISRLRALIERNQPSIVAIVETWLRDGHKDINITDRLGLHGWIIWRQDRDSGHHSDNAYGDDRKARMEGHRGGGIVIAWRPTTLSNGTQLILERNPSEDFADNIMSADILAKLNCQKCNDSKTKRFAFTVVYRRPVPSGDNAAQVEDQEVRNRLIHIGAAYRDEMLNYNGWSLVGDFNWREGSDNPYLLELLTFVEDIATVFPDPRTRTHQRGGCLDLVIASSGHVDGVVVSAEPISDHHGLVYNLNLGQDFKVGQKCEACVDEN